jgi:hypothetical protein
VYHGAVALDGQEGEEEVPDPPLVVNDVKRVIHDSLMDLRDKGAEELERKCKSALNNKRKKMEAKNKKKAEGETETEDEVIEDAGESEMEE